MDYTTDPRNNVTEVAHDAVRRPTVTKAHNGGVGATLLAASEDIYNLLGQVTTKRAGKTFSGTSVTAWQNLKTLTYTPTGKVWTEVLP